MRFSSWRAQRVSSPTVSSGGGWRHREYLPARDRGWDCPQSHLLLHTASLPLEQQWVLGPWLFLDLWFAAARPAGVRAWPFLPGLGILRIGSGAENCCARDCYDEQLHCIVLLWAFLSPHS